MATKREKKENVPTELLHLLDAPIAVSRILVLLTDSFPAGVMLGQCLYWQQRTRHEEGWFYKSRDEWQEEITLSRGEQERARKLLKSRGILNEKRCGMPSRTWYKIDLFELQNQLIDYHKTHVNKYRLRSESESFDLKKLSAIDAMELTGLHALSESAVAELLRSSVQPHATKNELVKILSPLVKVGTETAKLTFSYHGTAKVSDLLLRECRKINRLDELTENILDYDTKVFLQTTSIDWGQVWDWRGHPSFPFRVLFAKINGIIYAVDAEKEGKLFCKWVESLNTVR